MSRSVIFTALVMFVAGLLPFLWKVLVHDLPIVPSRESNVWRVELGVAVSGTGEPGSVVLRLPANDAAQLVLDEQVRRDGLGFEIREDPRSGERLGIWAGKIEGLASVAYTFRVHLRQGRQGATESQSQGEPPPVAESILEHLERLRVTDGDDADSILATLHSFVVHEVETTRRATDDAVLALATREGSPLGKARLLVRLLQAAGLDAHTVLALDPRAPAEERLVPLVEVELESGWTSINPLSVDSRSKERDLVLLARGRVPLVEVVGATQWALTTRVIHEPLDAREMVSFMTPASRFWRAVSLYRLPIGTQEPLRAMLVLPLAALITAVFRNIVGLRTFGVFMPALIALSLREIDLMGGMLLVLSVLAAGTTWRLFLDRLRLLFVPRVCLLLSLVVLMVTGISLVGYAFDVGGSVTGLLLPIVILSLLIERIAVTTIEEGPAQAGKLLLASLVVAMAAYPVFRSSLLAHLFFGFPELVSCIMGGLVLIGGYSGYRLTELRRFGPLAQGVIGK